jgi:hypothetical protein
VALTLSEAGKERIWTNLNLLSLQDKSYCYLCDDATVTEGDTVVVPVGSDGELKCVTVESVDVVTKDTAPFPIEQCKKVLEVIPEERILGYTHW